MSIKTHAEDIRRNLNSIHPGQQEDFLALEAVNEVFVDVSLNQFPKSFLFVPVNHPTRTRKTKIIVETDSDRGAG